MATKNDLNILRGENELKKQKGILGWLSDVDFSAQQYDYITRCEPGAGQWLLDSMEYRDWLAKSKRTLFCPGIPGAGKTYQTSILINNLMTNFKDDAKVGVAYLYCNFQRQQSLKTEFLLANLIKQLAQNLKPFPSSVQELYDEHQKRNTRPLLEELSTTLQAIGMPYSRVFIVVDALDECDDADRSRTKLLNHLFNAQTKIGLNLFATSRLIPGVMDRFESFPSVEIRPSHEDIINFLQKRMFQLPDFVVRDRNLQNEIKEEIESVIEGGLVPESDFESDFVPARLRINVFPSVDPLLSRSPHKITKIAYFKPLYLRHN